MDWPNSSRPGSCSAVASRRTPFTASNTRWCRMRPTRTCSRAAGRCSTSALLKRWKGNFRKLRRPNQSCWPCTMLEQGSPIRPSATGRLLPSGRFSVPLMWKQPTISGKRWLSLLPCRKAGNETSENWTCRLTSERRQQPSRALPLLRLRLHTTAREFYVANHKLPRRNFRFCAVCGFTTWYVRNGKRQVILPKRCSLWRTTNRTSGTSSNRIGRLA